MSSNFADSLRRIERAGRHAEAFTAEWNALLDPKTFQLRTEHKGDGTSIVFGSCGGLPKNDLALELGEFFYQLRAALDGLIFVTAELLSAPNPPAKEDRLEFPIYGDIGRFRKCPVWEGPFPQELKYWLDAVQPGNTTPPQNANTAEYRRRLKLLHDCARKDRHRRLHVVATIPLHFNVYFEPEIPGAEFSYFRPNLLEGEAQLVEVRIAEENWTNTQIHFKGNLTVNITIAEMPGLIGEQISRELEGLAHMVSLITKDFESAFP